MSCSIRESVLPKPRPVTVNGVVVSRDAIARESQNHPSETPIKAWSNAARSLVVRELLLQEARLQGVQAEPLSDGADRRETSDEALIRALIEREIVVPDADEQSCRRYYEMNRKRFRSADIFCAAHILFAAPADDREAHAAALAAARSVAAELKQNPDRFEDLARAHSACPSAAQGGNLGQIGKGQTTPEFELALTRLAPGGFTEEPVITRYGVHLIRLDRRIEGCDLPFEVAVGRIADYLAESAQRRAIARYIARLVTRADISGVELPDSLHHRVN